MIADRPSRVWAYRILLALNAPALAFALFMAVEALIVFGLMDVTGVVVRLAMLVWPLPQIAGYVAASKARRGGNAGRACKILLIQLILAGGVTAAYLEWVFQA